MRDSRNRPSRWLIAGLALAGVGVDLATLAWLWQVWDSQAGLTTQQLVLGGGGGLLAILLMSLAVAFGAERVR